VLGLSKKNKILIVLFYCFFGVLLIAGTFWDEQISKTLYSPDNIFGSIFNKIGEFPPYLTIPLFGTVFFYGKPKNINKALTVIWKIFFGTLCLAGFVFMTTKFGSHFLPKNDFRTPIEILVSIIFTVLSLVFGKRIPEKYISPLKKFSVFGVLAFAISGLGIDLIKSVWGRTRPRDMLKIDDFSNFSPWYIPQGKTKNYSFPSGHANQATLLFLITGLSEVFSSLKKYDVKLFILSWLFAFAVSLSRIIVGAHFLTDVTMGILITFTTILVLKTVIFKTNKEKTIQ
jgi:membrane-associated phospholipid phosphatase